MHCPFRYDYWVWVCGYFVDFAMLSHTAYLPCQLVCVHMYASQQFVPCLPAAAVPLALETQTFGILHPSIVGVLLFCGLFRLLM